MMDSSRVPEMAMPWWLIVIEGAAALVVGLLLLLAPGASTVILVQILGLYWLISGLFAIVSIFLGDTDWPIKALTGGLGIVAGLLIVQHPLWSTVLIPTTMVLVIGIVGILIGVFNLLSALRGAGWGLAFLGIVSLLFGTILLAQPLIGALAMPYALAITGVGGGIAAILYGLRIR